MTVRAEAQGTRERQAAAEAFDRGTTAYLAEDFGTAARWFEMANNLAPAAPALLQAIRAYQRAGNDLRAATLALRLVERFPDAGTSVDQAQQALDEVRGRFFLVEVACDEECAVELDGTLQAHPSFFLQPDQTHRVGASFANGNVYEEVSGAAGEQRTVRLAAPVERAGQSSTQAEPTSEDLPQMESAWTRRAPPEAGAPDRGAPERAAFDRGVSDESDGGIHPAGFLTTLALTLGAAGALVWSGMDTLSARDAYEAVAAQERRDGALTFPEARTLLDEGRTKELRTNVLIGATAGLAVLTVVLAIVTDWGSTDDDASASGASLRPTLAIESHGAGLGIGGTF